MHPQYLSQTLSIILTIILTFRTTSVFAQENEQYLNCTNIRLNCGEKFQNLRYPFWGGNRPAFCGHPRFELNCSGEEPQIIIDSMSYKVLGIDQAEHNLTVVRTDFLDEPCPMERKNTSLNPTFFRYGSGTQNLTFYYGCSLPTGVTTGLPSEFSCPGEAAGITNFYATDSWRSANTNRSLPSCGAQVAEIRIFNFAAANLENIMNETSQDRLVKAINSGFGIEWSANNSECYECLRSQGVCGSDNSTGEFRCYCKDRSYAAICGSDSVISTSSTGSSGKRIWLVIGIAASASSGIIVLSTVIVCYRMRESILRKAMVFWNRDKVDEFDVEAFIRNYGSFAPKRYSHATVKKMTNSFTQKIGKGGFGAVFKGQLSDGRLVAVKMLNESQSNGEEFINEVASIGRTSHVNIVTLLGFCYKGKKRALVYEYMPNGSLDNFIFNKESLNAECRLEWKTLYEIAIGIARGLDYLHRGCNTRILHFDIKPQNILLDEDFCPKISDFGLAKLWLGKESIVSTVGARGTIGYIAPEVFSRSYGGVSHKSDVYSYGMLILEMVGGRKNFDSTVSHTSEIYYPNRIYKDLETGNEASILGNMTEEEKAISKKMILVSFWCIQTNPADRPAMSKVVEMLEGSLESIDSPPKPYLFSPTRSP